MDKEKSKGKGKNGKPTARYFKAWGKGKAQWCYRRDGYYAMSIGHITDGESQEIYIMEKEVPFLIKALTEVQKKIAVAKALSKAGGKPFV